MFSYQVFTNGKHQEDTLQVVHYLVRISKVKMTESRE